MSFGKKIWLFSLTAMAAPSLALADAVSEAQKGLAPFERIFGPAKDPRLIVVNLINIFLGLLGIIFLVLIIYAGYLWMTSAGSEDKIRKAKSILLNSTIGLAIILIAWAVTRFAMCALISATADQYFWECYW